MNASGNLFGVHFGRGCNAYAEQGWSASRQVRSHSLG
jgi:hypothetical protein